MEERVQNWGILSLRVGVGLMFWWELFLFLHHPIYRKAQTGLLAATKLIEGLELPVMAALFLVGFIAGSLIIFGLFTRVAAGVGGLLMIGRFFLYHGPNLAGGVFSVGMYLLILAAALALMLTGPGRFSLEATLEQRREPKVESFEDRN